MMPMVDGFATLEQIKDERLHTLQSHFLCKKTRRKILKRNFIRANLYVTKALSIKKLVEQVQELIR
jgi:response regulator RpfG family c-di-GMP phosphodiesterase